MKTNITKIKKSKEDSKFGIYQYSIYNDSRINPLSFKLLLGLINAGNDWFFNLEHFAHTQELNIKTVTKSVNELIKCGYLSRTKIGYKYFYTVSEYGDLNKSNPTTEKILKPIQTPTPTNIIQPEASNQLKEEIKHIEITQEVKDKVILMIDDEFKNLIDQKNPVINIGFKHYIDKLNTIGYIVDFDKILGDLKKIVIRENKIILDEKKRLQDMIVGYIPQTIKEISEYSEEDEMSL